MFSLYINALHKITAFMNLSNFKYYFKAMFKVVKVRHMETKRCQTLQPSKKLWKQARYGFELNGTSMNQWCDAHGINRRNAWRAVIGDRNGVKSVALRQRVLEAAGVI
jgi:hypothetical protein